MKFVMLTNDVAESRPPKYCREGNIGGRYVRYGRTGLLLLRIDTGGLNVNCCALFKEAHT